MQTGKMSKKASRTAIVALVCMVAFAPMALAHVEDPKHHSYQGCGGNQCVWGDCTSAGGEAHARSPDWGKQSAATVITNSGQAHDEGHWYADASMSGSNVYAASSAGNTNGHCGKARTGAVPFTGSDDSGVGMAGWVTVNLDGGSVDGGMCTNPADPGVTPNGVMC